MFGPGSLLRGYVFGSLVRLVVAPAGFTETALDAAIRHGLLDNLVTVEDSISRHMSLSSPDLTLGGVGPFCHDDRPSRNIYMLEIIREGFEWPELRPIENYNSVHSLCVNTKDELHAPPGMGCECLEKGNSPMVRCRNPRRADPILAAHAVLIGFCEAACYCRIWSPARSDAPDEGGIFLTPGRSEFIDLTVTSPLSELTPHLDPYEHWDGRGDWHVVWYQDGREPVKIRKPSVHVLNPIAPRRPKPGKKGGRNRAIVGKPCTDKQDCGSTYECQAYGETFDPVKQAREFLALCVGEGARLTGVSAGSSGGRRLKRSIGVDGHGPTNACACNATYVSEACCGAGMAGVVWEDPVMKLGELKRRR